MSILSTALFTASLVGAACTGNIQEGNASAQNITNSGITFSTIEKEDFSTLQKNPKIQQLLQQCGITEETLSSLISGQCIIIRPGCDPDQPETDKPGNDNNGSEEDSDKPGNDNNGSEEDSDKPGNDNNGSEEDSDKPSNDNNGSEEDSDKPGNDNNGSEEDSDKPGNDNNGSEEDSDKPGQNKPGENNKPGGDNSSEEDATDSSYAAQVISLVNAERAKYSLAPLTMDQNVSAAALTRSKEIVTSFSHTRPNGSSFSTVFKEHNISYKGAGENIAWGQKTPEEVMRGWMNSDGHRANILNEKFTTIGVGYHVENGRTYWTQLFTY